MKQVLIAFDQLINAIFGGWADETISARSYRLSATKRRWYVAMRVIDCLFFFEADHCKNSYNSEKQRTQLPAEYR